MCSNLSFKVCEEVVYVLHGILTTRSDYFRAMLEGSFKEAHVPMAVDSEIPIHGVDVDVFKMIIEWIYTMEIKDLQDPCAPTILADLEKLYVAADMYMLFDLCTPILKYLESLLFLQTFGNIYQIAKRIGSKDLENVVFRSWISNSSTFNDNADQISALIKDDLARDERMSEELCLSEDLEYIDVGKDAIEREEDAMLYGISRKIVRASNWDGDKESKLCVIK
jgi:hypothetical protein